MWLRIMRGDPPTVEILILIRDAIAAYEKQNGKIEL